MFIDYIILGLISLATLIWAFTTLPDDASPDDDRGGTNVGGDSYPTGSPPSVIEEMDDEDETGTPDVGASAKT
jgi:hypothetical protein